MGKNKNTSDIHRSLHNSGAVNDDYSGKSGTVHIHEKLDEDGKVIGRNQRWEHSNGNTYVKNSEGSWRNVDNGNTPSQDES